MRECVVACWMAGHQGRNDGDLEAENYVGTMDYLVRSVCQ